MDTNFVMHHQKSVIRDVMTRTNDTLGNEQQLYEILHILEEEWFRHGIWLCVQWDLDLESRSRHTIGSWTATVWNIIKI